MDIKIQIQSTPNPNALKFVLNRPVKTEGKVTYKNADECDGNPLAKTIFSVDNVHEVFFFDNYITVTKTPEGDWDDVEEKVQDIILVNIGNHNADFVGRQTEPEIKASQNNDPEIGKINSILDETIRPALQMDGGDLVVMGLEGNTLKVNYQGACGSCPSATMGTLKAIENILRDSYNPELIVEIAE